jgi:hypothetical protein
MYKAQMGAYKDFPRDPASLAGNQSNGFSFLLCKELQIRNNFRAGGMVQVIEFLSIKHKAVSSNPYTTQKSNFSGVKMLIFCLLIKDSSSV